VLRVVVADDNGIVRRGVTAVLEASGRVEVVGVAADGRSAVETARRTSPDVVLLDVRMPGMDGIAAARELSGQCPVLMLSNDADDHTVLAAVRAGASGYLVHGHFPPEGLAEALETTSAGGAVVSPAVAAALVRSVRTEPGPPGPGSCSDGLSPRLREVMALLAAGCSNREIAGALVLSEKTVKNHVNAIFSRLGVQTRTAAAARWLGTAPAALPPDASSRPAGPSRAQDLGPRARRS